MSEKGFSIRHVSHSYNQSLQWQLYSQANTGHATPYFQEKQIPTNFEPSTSVGCLHCPSD
jgi:hypothetical protein